MTFTIVAITRCTGGGHWQFTVTVGTETRTLHLTRDELDMELGELRGAAAHRIRSALLEANAATWTDAQTALVGKTFKV